MEFQQTLSDSLPAPRDDEPLSLRQDIVDELADHLACSAQRELLRGADAATARARVLKQFGDPAAVARQLWLDAMKGKIMAQRVVIGTCVLVTAVSLGLVALLFQMTIDARRMAALQAAEAAARAAEARSREQEMLKRLGEMSEAIKHPRSPDWNAVRIELREETKDGPPVAGVEVALNRTSEKSTKTIRRTSDATGLIDFGSFQPGEYQFEVTRAWDGGFMSANVEVEVQAGKDVQQQIVCPKIPHQRVAVHVKWHLPSDLEKESLVLYAPFSYQFRETASNTRWKTYETIEDDDKIRQNDVGGLPGFPALPLAHSLLCTATNETSEFKARWGPLVWTIQAGNLGLETDDAHKLGLGDFADVMEYDLVELKPSSAPRELEIGNYALSELIVLQPSQSTDVPAGRRRFDLLAAVRERDRGRRIFVASKPPNETDFRPLRLIMAYGLDDRQVGLSTPGHISTTPTIELTEEFWIRASNGFEARVGKANEWTITLPDALIGAVREALKAKKSRAATTPEKADTAKSKG
jgi:hypothetical protein